MTQILSFEARYSRHPHKVEICIIAQGQAFQYMVLRVSANQTNRIERSTPLARVIARIIHKVDSMEWLSWRPCHSSDKADLVATDRIPHISGVEKGNVVIKCLDYSLARRKEGIIRCGEGQSSGC